MKFFAVFTSVAVLIKEPFTQTFVSFAALWVNVNKLLPVAIVTPWSIGANPSPVVTSSDGVGYHTIVASETPEPPNEIAPPVFLLNTNVWLKSELFAIAKVDW